MSRVAIVASRTRLRDTLVELAGAGLVELDKRHEEESRVSGETVARAGQSTPRLLARPADIDELERAGRWDLVAGELQLRQVAAQAVEHRGAAVLVGWTPEARLPELSGRLAAIGTAVVELAQPTRAEPPTLMPGTRVARSLRPLVDAYGTVPYADLDPSVFAGIAYVAMFGMMFGDVGHGLILSGLGLYLRLARHPALRSLQGVWAVIVGAGLASAAFGVLYGEAFGPTGVVPAVWLAPGEQPIALLVAGITVGSVLLGLSYAIGMVNRWREGGLGPLVYASSGIAGTSLYAGAAAIVAGAALGVGVVQAAGIAVAAIGLALLFVGFLAASGRGLAGFTEAFVELVDTVIRTASNAVSFVRLAAFGLTHAIIGGIVWAATIAVAASGGSGLVLAAIVFLAGNALAFSLEALVAGLQALRLEYYELFSRIFAGEGRPFVPWRLSVSNEEEP